MQILQLILSFLFIIAELSARYVGKEDVSNFFSKICNEIHDLDYKIAEALHFMEDGDTIIPNIKSYIKKVKEVATYVDEYYDVFAQYEKLVLERGPKKWFPVQFIEDVAGERFGWSQPDFQSLNNQFKNAQIAFLNLKTKWNKWKSKDEDPVKLWSDDLFKKHL